MWSLKKIHQIGELIAAVAVVVSLVFVGLQIRHNTVASEAATHQASVAYDLEILLSAGASPDTSRVYRAYRDDPDSLDTAELLQGETLFIALFRHNENIYLQRHAGMLSDDVWATRQPFMRRFVQTPGFDRLTAGSKRQNYGGPFIDYAEQIRSESNGDDEAVVDR